MTSPQRVVVAGLACLAEAACRTRARVTVSARHALDVIERRVRQREVPEDEGHFVLTPTSDPPFSPRPSPDRVALARSFRHACPVTAGGQRHPGVQAGKRAVPPARGPREAPDRAQSRDPMNHACPDLDTLIDLVPDGTGPEEVLAHLAICPSCQRELHFLRQVHGVGASELAHARGWIDNTLAQLPPPGALAADRSRWRSRVASLPASALAFLTTILACFAGGAPLSPAAIGLALAAASVGYTVDQRIPYSS